MSASLRLPQGGKITYDVAGSGPPLLLVSGLGGRAAFWSALVPELSRNFTVITYDHLGTGRSSRPDGPYSIAGMAADVGHLLADLQIETASMIGHSTGGAICQELAVTRSDLVGRLVLSATFAAPCAYFRRLFEHRVSIIKRAGLEEYRRLSVLLQYPPYWITANIALADAEMNAPLPSAPAQEVAIIKARIAAILAHDRLSSLAAIAAPTLIVTAADDMIVPSYHSQALNDHIPGSERITFERGGHFMPRTEPDAYLKALGSFLHMEN